MDKIIFTTILITFPLGQLIKFGMFNLFDVLIFVLAIWTFLQKPKYPKWFAYFLTFVLFGLFSWIFNYFVFNNILAFRGLLYLFRLLAYSYVAIYVSNFLSKKKQISIPFILITVSVATAALGWIQYLFLPDVRFLKVLDWDDHLYRMVGTFFDPAFLGLIFVLGYIISVFKKKNLISLVLIASLAFTYSRASYICFILFNIYELFKGKNWFRFLFHISLFTILILGLPKMLSEGTDFTRTVSSYNKLENYKETLEIIKKSPSLGVGFNNICLAKEKINVTSHACFGADNSILFILATTGIIGFFLFLTFVFQLSCFNLLSSTFFVVLVHGMFTNTLFYPHIMFWLFTLVGLGGEVNRKRS